MSRAQLLACLVALGVSSFLVSCDDQDEIDRLWAALSDGGMIEQCGWLRDRYGVAWQIVPTVLGAMMKDPDRGRAGRVMKAMLQMHKLDIAGLERAYAETPSPAAGRAV